MKKDTTHPLSPAAHQRRAQGGFSKVWTVITAAFFAALSYVLAHLGWHGNSIEEQTIGVVASHVIEQPTNLRGLISRMVFNGISPNTISFAFPPTGQPNEIFDPAGGQGTNDKPPSGIGNVKGGPDGTVKNAWGYKDTTDPLNGYYIKGAGSDENVFGRDIFAYLHGLSETACRQINSGFDIKDIPSQEGSIDYTSNAGKGLPMYSPGSNVFTAAPGNLYACIENVTDSHVYDYYHALLEK